MLNLITSTPSGFKNILFYKNVEKQISYLSLFKSKRQNRATFFIFVVKSAKMMIVFGENYERVNSLIKIIR